MNGDGTAQSERQPTALGAQAFRPDETGFSQLAVTGAGLASHLRFYDADLRADGHWGDLFDADELIVMGAILGHDAAPFQAAFDDDGTAMPLQRRVAAVLALAATVDRWYRQLTTIDGEGARALAAAIRLLVQRQLAPQMRWVGAAFVSPDWRGELKGYSFGKLEPMWFEAREPRGPADEAGRDDRLRQCFSALREAIERLKEAAHALVPASHASGSHEPAAALWIAFTQLFLTAQERINAFTARHTDFYYHEMLGMRPRPAEPDRVHLVCEAVPGTPGDVLVPSGTAFTAGPGDDGRPIEFIADSELAVTDLKVQTLLTLRLERGRLMLDDQDGEDCVKRIRVDTPGRSDTSAPGVWPLFGGEMRAGAAGARDAQIGFAVASPLLALKEGQREIVLTLSLQASTAGGGLWGRIGTKDDHVQWQVARAFPQLFRASLTTAQGWRDVGECYIARAAGADALVVTLHLPPEAPPVTGCDAQVHGAEWATVQPVLRLLARPDAAIAAYSLLQDMALAQISLEVRVHGARDLVIANQFGRLDPSMPFMPFGPVPQPGSYFVFGSAEAAAKPLTLVRLNIDWGGLPPGESGFAAYYEGYDSRFTNDAFSARTTVLQEGQWRGGGPGDGERLFDDGPGGRLAASTQVIVAAGDLDAFFKPRVVEPGGFDYAVGSRGGFFRLELREPRAAFGHAEYPRVLTRVVASNARRRRQEDLPRPPYTPAIERVTLDYEARATLKIGATGVDASPLEPFHIHPFGIERIRTRRVGCGALPVWSADGNLHIGLSGHGARGILTLLLELRAETARPALDRKARVRWAYLAGDRWIDFEPTRLLGDTTRGFLTSGIVTLDLPADMDSDHSVMPSDLFWLRLSADRDHDTFAGLASVRAHALSAVRSAASRLPSAFEPLPPGSIAGPAQSIAGLARATQVGPSFGMRPAETERQLQVRTGERLKHKSRALLPWDYERLVLERFPSAFKVRCLPCSRLPTALRSASPLVVVLPSLAGEEQLGYVTGPTLHAVELKRVREFLQRLAPPFAQVMVRNASYEGIQVCCAVRFKRGVHPGEGQRRVHRALFDYLSPWSAVGIGAHFDWLVRREDVESRLRQLDCVAAIGGVSLVHVAEEDLGRYSLNDTARPQGAARWEAVVATGAAQASARQPWSVAIPVRTHLIQVIDDSGEIAPRPTGVGQLGVGATFIVGGDA